MISKFTKTCKCKKDLVNYLVRCGLAFSFFYAGIGALTDPNAWIGFIPNFIEDLGISKDLFLKLHGGFDIFLGVWLLSGLMKVYAGLVAGIVLALIVIFSGTNLLSATFRDISLALLAFAYALDSCQCKSE